MKQQYHNCDRYATGGVEPISKALEEVAASFDRFCLAVGIEALGEMMRCRPAERRNPPRLSLDPRARQNRFSRRQD
jgi:hypothetical protein